MSIRIFYDEVKFRLEGSRRALKIIERVIVQENKNSGDLNFIITHDKSLRKINVQFLNHDYNTDVIAFDYCDGNTINGEIYISIDRVKINSFNYKISLKEELLRVMIHGVLHLAGYDDKTIKQKQEMRTLEDNFLRMKEI